MEFLSISYGTLLLIFLEELPYGFPQQLCHFTCLPTVNKNADFSTFLPVLVIFCSFVSFFPPVAILVGVLHYSYKSLPLVLLVELSFTKLFPGHKEPIKNQRKLSCADVCFWASKRQRLADIFGFFGYLPNSSIQSYASSQYFCLILIWAYTKLIL